MMSMTRKVRQKLPRPRRCTRVACSLLSLVLCEHGGWAVEGNRHGCSQCLANVQLAASAVSGALQLPHATPRTAPWPVHLPLPLAHPPIHTIRIHPPLPRKPQHRPHLHAGVQRRLGAVQQLAALLEPPLNGLRVALQLRRQPRQLLSQVLLQSMAGRRAQLGSGWGQQHREGAPLEPAQV